jgi:hypothetical protein
MTDDPAQAEEMQEQWLAFDCVAQDLVLDEPGWVSLGRAARKQFATRRIL